MAEKPMQFAIAHFIAWVRQEPTCKTSAKELKLGFEFLPTKLVSQMLLNLLSYLKLIPNCLMLVLSQKK
jgi:hypothetical protein